MNLRGARHFIPFEVLRKCVEDISTDTFNQSGDEVIVNLSAVLPSPMRAEDVEWDYHVHNILPAECVTWPNDLVGQAAVENEYKYSCYIVQGGDEETVNIYPDMTEGINAI